MKHQFALGLACGVGVALVGLFAVDPFVAAWRLPKGPLAERLAALDHSREGIVLDNPLSDLVPADAEVIHAGKGPQGPIKDLLRQARMECRSFAGQSAERRYYLCENRSAGRLDDGCQRDWTILFELRERMKNVSVVEASQLFIRSVC